MRVGRLVSRVRDGLSAGYHRLKTSVWPVVQAAVEASLAYFLAEVIIGHSQPFLAPIAAVICLSVTLGQRNRRAFELVFPGGRRRPRLEDRVGAAFKPAPTVR